jgi:hypothetical protein
MKLLGSSALVLILAAACGGKSTPSVGNVAGGGAAAVSIPSGIHGCHFVIGSDVFAAHRCDVTGAQLEKVSGMELFRGELAPMGTGLHFTGAMGCGPMVDKCDQAFEVHLEKTGATWQGTVTAKGEAGGWWLAGATLVLDDSLEYGGAHYGGAHYGGE